MAEDEGQPVSYDELITALAKKHGVSPTLAKAVADRESGFDTSAVGKDVKGENARGIMQLMPGTAKDMGVTMAHDPVQNITGGVKYLKLLEQRYNGDTTKILQAYNGGMGNVDKGTVSPEAQSYATAILSKITRQAVAQPKVAAAGGPGTTPETPEEPTAPKEGLPTRMAKGAVKGVWNTVNPMTPEGRTGLGGLIGGAGGAILSGGNPAAAVAGAGAGGVVAGEINQLLEKGTGAFTREAQAEALKQGFEQSAYGAIGEAGGALLARGGRAFAGSKYGKPILESLENKLQTTKATAKEAVSATKEAASNALSTARRSAAERSAAADLEAAELAKGPTTAYEGKLGAPPSKVGTTEAARGVLAGLPGLPGPSGPVKAAQDMVGREISKVAESGPAINMTPIKEALAKMTEEARPSSLFKEETPSTRGIGFLQFGKAANARAVAEMGATGTQGGISGAEKAKFAQKIEAAIREQIPDLPANHPLPGILAKVQTAPESISFADAHQLKRLLDESVNWDRTAKKHLEGLTKAVRSALSGELNQYEPYAAANAAYRDMVKLTRTGTGKEFVNATINKPDKLAGFLKSGDPQAADAVQKLLVDQSVKGGDAAAGQRAWDAVRSQHTYNSLVVGGVDKLEQRVQAMLTQNPEFAKVVYGDAAGKAEIANLLQIGKAAREATELGASMQAQAKTAGAAGIESAKAAGKKAVKESVEAGRSDVMAAARDLRDVKRSSVGPFLGENPTETVTRGVALAAFMASHPHAWAPIRFALHFLNAPTGPDLIAAAAKSGVQTGWLVKALNGTMSPQILSNIARIAGTNVKKATRERREAANTGNEDEESQAVNQ